MMFTAHQATLLLILVGSALSLFQDQAGLFDWKQDYVGRVKEFYWEMSPTSGKKILVASDKNVIASINANDGSIAWRRIFEASSRGRIDSFLYQGSGLVSIHAGGHYVRSWQVLSGSLLWEKSLPSDPDTRASGIFLTKNGKEHIVVSTSSTLHCLRLQDGGEEWKATLPSSDSVERWHLRLSGSQIVAVGVSPGQKVTVVTLTLEGVVKQHANVPAPWITTDTSCVVLEDGQHFVCYAPLTQALQLLTVDNAKVFKTTSLSELGLTPADTEAQIESTVPELKSSLMFRSRQDCMAVLSVSTQHTITVHSSHKMAYAAQVMTHADKPIVLTLTRLDSESLLLNVYDLETNDAITELVMPIPFAHYHGTPTKMYPFLFAKRKDSSSRPGCKLIFAAQDFSLHFAQKNRPSWRREESLAYIQAVQMVDLPVSENQAKFEDEFGTKEEDILAMFIKRLKAQFSQAKGLVLYLRERLQGHTAHAEVNLDAIEEEEPSEGDLIRDDFNLHKIIVVATASGKIYGIRSHSGKVAWQQFVPDLTPLGGGSGLMLMVQRTTAHFPHLPQATVLGVSKKSGNGLVVTVNPISGHMVEGQAGQGHDLGFKVVQAEMLAEMDADFLRRIVLVDKDTKPHLYPSGGPELLPHFQMQMFLHLIKPELGTMAGYRLTAGTGSSELELEEIWNLDLQRSQQTVTGIYAKRALEHVHSQGRVLGDRSVLYKYLNPNLVAVVAEGEETPLPSSSKGPSSFFSIYLVDGVTGHIVHHQSHKRSRGPIQVIHSENWLVYSYFNDKHRRNEMAVLELFEGKEQSNSTAFSSFSPPPPPLVLRQSYIFPEPIYAMGATVTEKGIASKNIIISLKIGGILSLPKALLDPRRPAIPTQETQEEGTIPYVPEIPLSTEALVNYNKSTFNVEGIFTSPAGLESTSLVFVYGVDIFFTRVMPSRMFDVLKEDFDYLFIGSVLGVMILVSFLTQKLAARKALNRAWK